MSEPAPRPSSGLPAATEGRPRPVTPEGEPQEGKGSCFDCGAFRLGPYCQECGQRATKLEPTVREILSEFLGSFLSLDSRIFRTSRVLVTRPGQLSVDYREGRRTRYVTPLRLYLAIGVVLFLVLAFTEVEMFRVTSVGEPTEALAEPGSPAREPADTLASRFSERVAKYQDDPSEINEMLAERLPQVFFLLVPVVALGLRLAYWRQGIVYSLHFVHVLHLQSFLFLIALTVVVVERVVDSALVPVLALAAYPVYVVLSLRRFYGQSWWVTGLKALLLAVGYVVLLFLTLLVLAFVGIYVLGADP